MPLANDIRAFIVDNFLFGDTSQDLGDDVSLIEAGIVDSTGILEVLAFVEGTFEIRVEDSEAIPANLDSIRNIVSFVGRKLEQRPAEAAAA